MDLWPARLIFATVCSGHPYIVSRQRPVRPDEQYPVVMSYNHPSLHLNHGYYCNNQPLFSSLNNYLSSSDLPGYSNSSVYPVNIDQQPKDCVITFCVSCIKRSVEKETAKVKNQKPQIKILAIKSQCLNNLKQKGKKKW